MQGTENYDLYLTGDSKVKFFKEWREKMNGVKDSNIIRIDAILAGKAVKSAAITKILSADGWENAGTAFTQEITIEGLTAEQNGVIGAAQNLTETQLEVVRAAGLYVQSQSQNSLVIASDGEVPTCDIPVVIILLG